MNDLLILFEIGIYLCDESVMIEALGGLTKVKNRFQFVYYLKDDTIEWGTIQLKILNYAKQIKFMNLMSIHLDEDLLFPIYQNPKPGLLN